MAEEFYRRLAHLERIRDRINFRCPDAEKLKIELPTAFESVLQEYKLVHGTVKFWSLPEFITRLAFCKDPYQEFLYLQACKALTDIRSSLPDIRSSEYDRSILRMITKALRRINKEIATVAKLCSELAFVSEYHRYLLPDYTSELKHIIGLAVGVYNVIPKWYWGIKKHHLFNYINRVINQEMTYSNVAKLLHDRKVSKINALVLMSFFLFTVPGFDIRSQESEVVFSFTSVAKFTAVCRLLILVGADSKWYLRQGRYYKEEHL